ncbi:M56 family metallopeptidase [Chryseobacterium koreense]|uniref:M56 family metallopeptidase n=1 Tax=Chryseobacterium koreense TaxID=232216 RepID=UPI0026EB97DF|nr:M56 family metallopeptidase [Chryseobacterium koreense]
METLLYFGKVILCSGVMFLYYRLFLKDKTFHHYNRFYLLSVLWVSLLLPLLKVSYFTLEVNNDIYLLFNKLQNFNSNYNSDHDFIYLKIAAFIFGLVSVFFLARLIFGLVKIQLLKKQFSKERFEGISFYETDLQEAPFSFFKNLFWKKSILLQSDLGKQILKHEMVHIEQKHSWDKIFMELATSLFWFNPFFHLIKKEITLVHEYLADKKAIKNSDTKAFAQMLLASHFSGKQFPATSPFFNSNLKRRLIMLKKSKTKFSYARKIFALPLLFAIGFIYLVNAKNREIRKTNLEIEQLVSELQTDTLKPKSNSAEAVIAPQKMVKKDSLTSPENPPRSEIALGTDGTKIHQEHPELFLDGGEKAEKIRKEIEAKRVEIEPLRIALESRNSEARKFGEELRNKGEEYRKMAEKMNWDDPKFKKLQKEMDELNLKMDGIFNSPDFKTKMEAMNFKFGELDKLFADLDKFYQSDDFKKQIEISTESAIKAQDFVNSKEFKNMMRNAENQAKVAEKAAKNAEKLVNSIEFKQNLENAKKAAQIGKSNVIVINGVGKTLATDDETKIFLDGKPITKSEMEKFPADKIEKMEVNKKGYEGKTNSEIRIYTKK